ncbi:unnamed protein product, partial [Prorocentrum cordatum]
GEGVEKDQEALEGSGVCHYIYVDNLGILTCDPAHTASILSDAASRFESAGLVTHEHEVSVTSSKALGTHLDLVGLGVSLSPSRLWKVRQGVLFALSCRKLPGRVWEVLLGHLTFCALINRSMMSVFRSIYAFIGKYYATPMPLWDTARQEMLAAASLLFLMDASWSLPWAPNVVATDASEEGFGAAISTWDPRDVATVGRIMEMGRFRRLPGVSARSRFFGALEDLESDLGGDDLDRPYDVDTGFPEVPHRLLSEARWSTLLAGPWRYFDEGIFTLEARALVLGFQALVSEYQVRNARLLFLVDNMGLNMLAHTLILALFAIPLLFTDRPNVTLNPPAPVLATALGFQVDTGCFAGLSARLPRRASRRGGRVEVLGADCKGRGGLQHVGSLTPPGLSSYMTTPAAPRSRARHRGTSCGGPSASWTCSGFTPASRTRRVFVLNMGIYKHKARVFNFFFNSYPRQFMAWDTLRRRLHPLFLGKLSDAAIVAAGKYCIWARIKSRKRWKADLRALVYRSTSLVKHTSEQLLIVSSASHGCKRELPPGPPLCDQIDPSASGLPDILSSAPTNRRLTSLTFLGVQAEWVAQQVDASVFDALDLTLLKNIQLLCSEAKARKLVAAMIAIESGNLQAQRILKFIRYIHALGIPWAVENPNTSILWWVPGYLALAKDPKVSVK